MSYSNNFGEPGGGGAGVEGTRAGVQAHIVNTSLRRLVTRWSSLPNIAITICLPGWLRKQAGLVVLRMQELQATLGLSWLSYSDIMEPPSAGSFYQVSPYIILNHEKSEKLVKNLIGRPFHLNTSGDSPGAIERLQVLIVNDEDNKTI